jgi:hypothetical protein
MPKPPPNLKVQRAKTIVDDTGIKILTECERCGLEKYIVERQTVCEECRSIRQEESAKAQDPLVKL